MLRSIPFASDWFTLGCTTRSAAMAANIGKGCCNSRFESSQATIAATDVLTTCNRGLRADCRRDSSGRIAGV